MMKQVAATGLRERAAGPAGRTEARPVVQDPSRRQGAAGSAGAKSAFCEHASLRARFSDSVLEQQRSRFAALPRSQPPAAPARIPMPPAHSVLAARLTELAARQQRRLQQQQQRQRRGRHGSTWSHDLKADVRAVCREVGLPDQASDALAAAAAQSRVSGNPGVLLSQLVRLLQLQPLLAPPCSLGGLLAAAPTLVACDPGTLAANLVAAQQLLGAERCASALARHPQLLCCSPFRLHSNVAALQALLGLGSAAAAAAVASRQPMLLLASPRGLRARAEQLRQLMHAVPAEELARQLRRNPELLLLRPSTIAAKLSCLELVFAPPAAARPHALSGHTAAAAARQLGAEAAPPVAGGPGGSALAAGAAAAVGAAAAALAADGCGDEQRKQMQLWMQQQRQQQEQQQMQGENSQELVLRTYRRQELAYRLSNLKLSTAALQQRQQQQHHHHRQGRQVQPQWLAGGAAGHRSGGSSSSSSDGRAQRLALKLPALLSMSPSTLHQHLVELQLLLQLQPGDERLQRAVQLQPGLLTQAPATLANKLQLLQHLTGRGEADAQEMALRCPAVLTLSATSLGSKWRLLASCAAACAAWQQQLRSAAPVTVAMALCYSPRRLQRLQYILHAHGAAPAHACAGPGGASAQRPGPDGCGLARVPWRTVVQESEAAFCGRFPGWPAWAEQQEQQQQQQADMRGAAGAGAGAAAGVGAVAAGLSRMAGAVPQ